MKNRCKYTMMAALAVVGAILVGCASEDMANKAPQAKHDNKVIQTTTISLSGSAGTRALDADGKKTFAVGDQIAIYYKNTSDELQLAESTALTANDISSDGKTATIKVEMTDPKPESQLRYIYPAAMGRTDIEPAEEIENTINYDNLLEDQDGTLEKIASTFDLAVYDGKLTSNCELPGSATLKNQLAIAEFTFKDDGSNDITSTIKQLTINDGSNIYVVNRTPAAGPVYVAMCPAASKDFQLNAITTSIAYKKSVSAQSLAASNVYPINVTMEKDMEATPLTLEAIDDGTITFTNKATGPVKYKIDGGAEQTIAADGSQAVSVTAGQKVTFFGDNATYYNNDNSIISCTADCYIYGNIMSLVSSTDYATATELTGNNTFYDLFQKNTHIKNHATHTLVLPATTLTDGCYNGMFDGCTSLTAAPALPATILAYRCYTETFRDCTSLTKAPDLPATYLYPLCYFVMFYGCTKLSSVTCLATDLANNCLDRWLDNAGTDESVTSRTLHVKNGQQGNDWKTPTGTFGWIVVDDQ